MYSEPPSFFCESLKNSKNLCLSFKLNYLHNLEMIGIFLRHTLQGIPYTSTHYVIENFKIFVSYNLNDRYLDLKLSQHISMRFVPRYYLCPSTPLLYFVEKS